jgi:NDP-sugar pyrophosphorylase family protein
MRPATPNNDIAVVGFSDAKSPLEPAWPSTHRALLPVGGKAVIVYAIEQLKAAGIGHIRVAGSLQKFAVRKKLGNGEEWGVTLRYSDLHDADLLMQTLLEHGECLYILGDQMLDLDLELVRRTSSMQFASPLGRMNIASYWKLEQTGFTRAKVSRNESRPDATMLSVSDFHLANRLAITSAYSGLNLPGSESDQGAIVDWQSHVDPRATVANAVMIGKHCFVGRGVTLDRNTVIGNGAVISRNCHFSNVTVLPNCFVGPDVKLRDAVVTPSGIFDLKGNFWPVLDRALLCRARPNAEQKTGLPTEALSEIERRGRVELLLPA